jgi:hypothetical protein
MSPVHVFFNLRFNSCSDHGLLAFFLGLERLLTECTWSVVFYTRIFAKIMVFIPRIRNLDQFETAFVFRGSTQTTSGNNTRDDKCSIEQSGSWERKKDWLKKLEQNRRPTRHQTDNPSWIWAKAAEMPIATNVLLFSGGIENLWDLWLAS